MQTNQTSMTTEKPSFRWCLTTRIFSLVLFLPVFLLSCVTQHEVEYLQDSRKEKLSFREAAVDDYRLKPNDELFIQISSLDDPAANVFSSAGGQQTYYMGTFQPYGASLVSHTVDKDGFLVLPVIGKIAVTGYTTTQLSETIKSALTNVLSQPVVSVKLVNRYVSVLGEVQQPGHYAYAQDKLTILDAIGLAGDITDYGNRKEIVLTRNENGENTRVLVDITRSDLLSSEYYLIRPNDIVYVKPLTKKFWGMRQFQYSVVLSTITTAILFYSVLRP
jgi:polysaccharide biosynthesis/export protein